MKRKNSIAKSIQKPLARVSNLQQILKKNAIDEEDLKSLTESELTKFYDIASNEITSSQRSDNYESVAIKFFHAMPQNGKDQIWDINHLKIIYGIKNCLRENGVFPTKTLLSNKTGLSRNTIQNHLARFSNSDHGKFINESKKLVHESLMSTLLFHAMNGNMKAARLYMEASGMIGAHYKTTEGSNSNFIQVNGMTLNQTFINQLPPDTILRIEKLLKQFNRSSEGNV